MPKQMLVVTGRFPVTSQTFVLREIMAAKQRGWGVHVLAAQDGAKADWMQASEFGILNSDVTYMDWRSTPLDFSIAGKRFRQAADRETYGHVLAQRRIRFFRQLSQLDPVRNADLVHCHFVEAAAGVGVGLSRLFDIPMTVEVHDSFLESHSTDVLTMIQQAATGIGCVSSSWINIWSDRTGMRDKLFWLPNGVESREFPVTLKRTEISVPTILSVSNCARHKRPDDLLRAVRVLKDRGEQCRVVLIGGGPFLDELQQFANETDVSDIVTFCGRQPHSVVRREMAKASIFALCSERESFGIVTVEAMASGIPCVVSRTAGAKDIVLENVTGLTFDVGDVAQLAEHLQRLISDCDLRHRLGAQARVRAASVFSWDRHMSLISDVWDSAISGSANGVEASIVTANRQMAVCLPNDASASIELQRDCDR